MLEFFKELSEPLILVSILGWLALVSCGTYQLGQRAKAKGKTMATDVGTASVLSLLALILGFSFEITVSRNEARRSLTIDEANAIHATFLQSKLIKFSDPERVRSLFREFTDLRIEAYVTEHPIKLLHRQQRVEEELWQTLKDNVDENNRGDIESNYSSSLSNMIEISNARSHALSKMLPPAFYLLLILVATVGFAAFNYDRGFSGDTLHWKSAAFLILFSIFFTFIFDLDHARDGLLVMSQDAILLVREKI